MRGGSIVTTFIFSIIFLKIKVMKNQVVGAALALFDVIVVGFSNMVFFDNTGSDQNALNIVLYRHYKSLAIYFLFFLSLQMVFIFVF